jgi:hypothetical protein
MVSSPENNRGKNPIRQLRQENDGVMTNKTIKQQSRVNRAGNYEIKKKFILDQVS